MFLTIIAQNTSPHTPTWGTGGTGGTGGTDGTGEEIPSVPQVPLVPPVPYTRCMRILGIDPGLATVGIGIIDAAGPQDLQVVDWLTITTKAGVPLPERLREIGDDLASIIRNTAPHLAVVERLFFATNEQTAIDVAQARGVILRELAVAAVPILEPSPLQLKLAITGDGTADKRQVQSMLPRLLELQEIPRPDDAADALALAIYGALQHSTLTAHRAARAF